MVHEKFAVTVTALAVAFGSSFQVGYLTFMYNGPQDILEEFVNGSFEHITGFAPEPSSLKLIWSTIAGLSSLGKMIACLGTAYLADWAGRKAAFLYTAVPAVISFVIPYLAYPANNFYILGIGRFVNGLHMGTISVVAPLFLTEIAVYPNRRTVFSRMHNIISVVGSIVAIILGFPEILGTNDRWAYLCLIPIPLVILQSLWLLKAKESPTYLYNHQSRSEDFEESAKFYLGTGFQSSPNLGSMLKAKKKPDSSSKGDLIRTKYGRKALYVCCASAVATVFSGGSVLNNYQTAMFAGFGEVSKIARVGTAISNSISIVVLLVGVYFMNKFGRKPMLIFSLYASLLCLGSVFIMSFFEDNTIIFWVRFAVLLFWPAVRYFISTTAVLIVLEAATGNLRAFTLSLHKLIGYVGNTVVTVAFSPIAFVSEPLAYGLLLVPYVVTCVYLTVVCPETKDVNFLKSQMSEQEKQQKRETQDLVTKV